MTCECPICESIARLLSGGISLPPLPPPKETNPEPEDGKD